MYYVTNLHNFCEFFKVSHRRVQIRKNILENLFVVSLIPLFVPPHYVRQILFWVCKGPVVLWTKDQEERIFGSQPLIIRITQLIFNGSILLSTLEMTFQKQFCVRFANKGFLAQLARGVCLKIILKNCVN